jgi:hypothetical protein
MNLKECRRLNVGLLSRNLPGRTEEKHAGSQDSRCPGRDSSWEPPKYRLKSLLLWQNCLVRQYDTCNLQINSLFHTNKVQLEFDNTVHATQYVKLIRGLWILRCTSVEVMFNASPIESQHVSFLTIFITLCAGCLKPPVCHIKLINFFLCRYLQSRHLRSSSRSTRTYTDFWSSWAWSTLHGQRRLSARSPWPSRFDSRRRLRVREPLSRVAEEEILASFALT